MRLAYDCSLNHTSIRARIGESMSVGPSQGQAHTSRLSVADRETRRAFPMKVVVLVKQVPLVTDLKFDPATKTLIREGVPNVINPYDRYAIVESVKLKKAHGGEAIAVTMGPPQAREAMVEALALGCDRAVHIVDRAFAGSDTLATARALSLFLKKEGFDLIFCGKHSVDAETGQVGPEVAELLDIPQITGIIKLEVAKDGRHIKATRGTDEGREIIECDLPVLLSAEERLNRPGPTPPEALEAARSRPIEVVTANDLSPDHALFGFAGSPTWVSEIYSVATERKPVMLDGAAVDEVVHTLTEHLLAQGLFGTWQGAQEVPRVKARPPGARPERAVWVVAETLGGKVRSATHELLGKAVELADRLQGEVVGVLIGSHHADPAAELAAYGADRVLLVEGPQLSDFSPEGYANALARAIQKFPSYAVLIPATDRGRDFAPRAAARLQLGLTGAAIGATRRVTDAGWLPRQHQVGLTGKAVAPQLYFALGIRGAMNHTIGIQRAHTIVALNKDPEAPIFQVANYGIVGNCLEVIPALTQALAEAKQRRQG